MGILNTEESLCRCHPVLLGEKYGRNRCQSGHDNCWDLVLVNKKYIPQSCQVISYNCAMASVSWPTAMELLREMVINAYQPTAACMHQGEVLGGF